MRKINTIATYLLSAFIFLLPWQTAWIWHQGMLNASVWQYGTFVLYGTECVLWLAFIFFLIATARRPVSRGFVWSDKNVIFVISLILLAWTGSSLFWSHDRFLSYYYWFHLAEGLAFLFVLLSLKIDTAKIYVALLASGAVQSCLAIGQFIVQRTGSNKWLGMAEHLPAQLGTIVIEAAGERILRPYGSFTHPNVLAGFLVICFLCGVLLYFKNVYKKYEWPIVIAIIVCLMGIFLSFSRSGIAVGVVGFVLLLMMNRRAHKKEAATIKIIACVAIVAVIIITYPLIKVRLGAEGRLENISINQRIDYIAQAKNIIAAHPWIGTGIGTYTLSLYEYNKSLPAWEYQPVHTIYLLLWAEIGLTGLLIFVGWYIAIMWRGFVIKNQATVLMGALLIIGLVDHYLVTSYVGIFLIMISALLALKEETNL